METAYIRSPIQMITVTTILLATHYMAWMALFVFPIYHTANIEVVNLSKWRQKQIITQINKYIQNHQSKCNVLSLLLVPPQVSVSFECACVRAYVAWFDFCFATNFNAICLCAQKFV